MRLPVAGECRVFLTVLKNNVNAIEFYRGLKYAIDENSPSKGGEAADHEIMSKRLPSPPAKPPAAGVA